MVEGDGLVLLAYGTMESLWNTGWLTTRTLSRVTHAAYAAQRTQHART